jgi:TrmH family RNA methyltransferase
MTITSHDNEHLKEVRKLNQRRRQRDRMRRFVAEGEDLLQAADAAGWTPVYRLCADGSGLPGTEVEPRLLDGVSELGSGTRTLAVYDERWATAPAGPLCVSLHGVQDPGNVGTILRSAQAFGAASVAIGPGTADPYGPKAVRASMGAIFAIQLVRIHDIAELPAPTIALTADAADGAPLHSIGLQPHATLLIGSERHGLPSEIVQRADHVAHIPIATHSLNAAMAATVALYEASRMARDR